MFGRGRRFTRVVLRGGLAVLLSFIVILIFLDLLRAAPRGRQFQIDFSDEATIRLRIDFG
jgi:hypothetical protein